MRYLLGTPAVDTIPFKGGAGNGVPISQVEIARRVLRR